MNVLAMIIQPTDICLDAGGNIGIYTMFLSELAEKVYAFEPSSINAAFLADNIAANEIDNAEVERIGLGAFKEKKSFFHMSTLPGCSFVNADDDRGTIKRFWGVDHEHIEEQIQIERLDDWLDERDIERVDFIKMDVEGSEPSAIEGGQKLFSKQRPTFVIEFNRRALAQKYGTDPEILYDLLTSYYSYIYVLEPDVTKPPALVKSYAHLNEFLPDKRFWADLLCLNRPFEQVRRRAT